MLFISAERSNGTAEYYPISTLMRNRNMIEDIRNSYFDPLGICHTIVIEFSLFHTTLQGIVQA